MNATETGRLVRLLNSAMMPRHGWYDYRPCQSDTFVTAVKNAHAAGALRSYIGYEQTAKMIEDMTGVPIPVSREQTPVNVGDMLLICKLAYRVGDPKTKGQPMPADFEFGVAHFAVGK